MPKSDTWYKPGQSGNPSGKAPGEVSLVTLIRKKLREDPERAEAIIENLFEMAKDREPLGLKAVQTLLDRVDGAVTKKIDVSGALGLSKLVQLEGDDGDAPSEAQVEERVEGDE